MTDVSDEVVETVAQAICRAAGGEWKTGAHTVLSGPNFEPEEHPLDPTNNHWRYQAKAALEASGYAALKADNERMKEGLTTLVYEATHLSPMEDDGSHWAKISKDALGNARTILQEVFR